MVHHPSVHARCAPSLPLRVTTSLLYDRFTPAISQCSNSFPFHTRGFLFISLLFTHPPVMSITSPRFLLLCCGLYSAASPRPAAPFACAPSPFIVTPSFFPPLGSPPLSLFFNPGSFSSSFMSPPPFISSCGPFYLSSSFLSPPSLSLFIRPTGPPPRLPTGLHFLFSYIYSFPIFHAVGPPCRVILLALP